MRHGTISFLIYCFFCLSIVLVLVPVNSSSHNGYSNGAIAMSPDGRWIVAANPDSNSVSLIETTNNFQVTEVAVGIDPRAVTVHDSWAYVVNQGSDSITIIDLDTHAILGERSVGDRPVNVILSPDLHYAFVANSGDDTISWLDSSSVDTIDVFEVADRPYGLEVTPDGANLLVTHLLSGSVTVIPLENPEAITTIETWANIAPAPAAIVNASGTRAYLPQTMAHGQGLNTQFDNSVFPKVSVIDLENNVHLTSEHISLPETDQPVGLPWDATLARDDSELWVVNSGSNDVSVINISNPQRSVRAAHIVVGDNPRGIVISPDGTHAYVNNTLSGTISVIDAQTYTVINEISTTTIPLPPLLLNGKRLFFSSATEDLAQAGWISCNTCHIEGEHDGRTWLLQFTGEVPVGASPVIRRNTTSLLGMIETYPLRWSAEWDESADSEFSIRFEQYGTGLIHDGVMNPTLGVPNQGRSYDLDSLAAFIDSLQVPERERRLTELEEQGRLLFESSETECSVCHPGPLYTDLQVHDVGTADGDGEWFGTEIDTPTLRFLYDSGPYLHDGSAETLYDVLTVANANDEHGIASHLSEDEIEALVAFMLALPYLGQ
jgi:large repetitive protein